MIKSKAVTAGVSGGVDFTVLAREVGSLKMYDWKTFLAALLLGGAGMAIHLDRKSTRLNSSHTSKSRMPSSA